MDIPFPVSFVLLLKHPISLLLYFPSSVYIKIIDGIIHWKLTAHNWQIWKRVFLTCPCHKIYTNEAVGLKSCKYTWKITIFVKFGAITGKFDILSITA